MKEQIKKKEEDLNGVEGWLAFFVVTIMIISPILSFSLSFSDGTGTTTTWDFILILAQISVMILAGIFLIQKKYYAVTFTKIVLWGMLISIIFDFFCFIYT